MNLFDQLAGCAVHDKFIQTCVNVERLGWRSIAGGNYSKVYEHASAPGVVCKVSGVKNGSYDGYAAYVYWCMANPHPNLPVFYGIKNSGSVTIVLIKRYCPISDSYATYDLTSDEQYEADRQYNEARAGIFGHPGTGPQEAGFMVHEFFNAFVDWDFHRGNAMWDRETKQIIITDPYHCLDANTETQLIRDLRGPKRQRQITIQPTLFPVDELQMAVNGFEQHNNQVYQEVWAAEKYRRRVQREAKKLEADKVRGDRGCLHSASRGPWLSPA